MMDWVVEVNVLVFSLLTCLCLVPASSFIANRVGLVDLPSARKRHVSPTPLVGGVCVFSAFVAAVFFVPGAAISWSMIGWLSLVLAIGVVDDYVDISPKIRLLAHGMIVVGIASTEGLYVSNVGAITGGSEAQMGSYAVAVAFTVVGVLGAVNAVNMSDGVDGLLGLMLALSLLAVLFLISTTESSAISHFSRFELIAVFGALLGFLVFNSRLFTKRALIFFGDAGSTTIGFLFVYVLINCTQGSTEVFSPVLTGWIVGLPLIDASAVIVSRTMNRQSPFGADRTHLHHKLMDSGISVNHTVLILCGLHFGLILFAITVSRSGYQYSDALLFWGFIALVVFRVAIVSRRINWLHVRSKDTVVDRYPGSEEGLVSAQSGSTKRTFRSTSRRSGHTASIKTSKKAVTSGNRSI